MPHAPLVVRPAASHEDLLGIVALQGANHRDSLSLAERAADGFVSLRHSPELLREMNSPWPHAVAVTPDDNRVVGYALTMEPRFRERLPLLHPMFDRLESLSWRGRPLAAWRWYVMGQVCVAREHRGQGLVPRLYAEQRRITRPGFDLVVTEISGNNPRSLRAHEKDAWRTLETYMDHDEPWVIVARELA